MELEFEIGLKLGSCKKWNYAPKQLDEIIAELKQQAV